MRGPGMSRSYRKRPILKDHNKGAKRRANKAVRRCGELADGGNYRKVYSSYDISDWAFVYRDKPEYGPEYKWRRK